MYPPRGWLKANSQARTDRLVIRPVHEPLRWQVIQRAADVDDELRLVAAVVLAYHQVAELAVVPDVDAAILDLTVSIPSHVRIGLYHRVQLDRVRHEVVANRVVLRPAEAHQEHHVVSISTTAEVITPGVR